MKAKSKCSFWVLESQLSPNRPWLQNHLCFVFVITGMVLNLGNDDTMATGETSPCCWSCFAHLHAQ